MLKSSEHEKSLRYLNYKSPNFQYCSEVKSADPPIDFSKNNLRIGGPDFKVSLLWENTYIFFSEMNII